MATSQMSKNSNGDYVLNITPNLNGQVVKTLYLSTSNNYPNNDHCACIDRNIIITINKESNYDGLWYTNWFKINTAGIAYNPDMDVKGWTRSIDGNKISIYGSINKLQYSNGVSTLTLTTKNKFVRPNTTLEITVYSALNTSFSSPAGYIPKASSNSYMCKASSSGVNILSLVSGYSNYTWYVDDSFDAYLQASNGSSTANINAGDSFSYGSSTYTSGGYYTGTPGSGFVWHPGTSYTYYGIRKNGEFVVEHTSASNVYLYAKSSIVSNVVYIHF